MDKLQKKIKEIPNVYYINDNLTSKNYPKPKNLRKKNVKVIEMSRLYSSEEALAEMKRQGCTPMNVWELVEWIKAGNAEKGKWYVAMDEKDALWKDAYGLHRVPFVIAFSDGDFQFNLGYFEDPWDDVDCLLCFCDSPSDTQALSKPESLDTLTLESAIKIVKENGYKIYKEI